VRGFALMRAARAKKFTALIEPDFFAKVEKLLCDMAVKSKRAKAEAALKALVSTVEVKEKGTRVFRPASKLSLSFAKPGPTISGWK